MHLVYLDESGNTGMDLANPQQPVFCLCAMIVDEDRWQSLERDLQAVLDERMKGWRETERFEIHATDLRSGKGVFKGVPVADRIAFRDAWMDVGRRHRVKLIYRRVIKAKFAAWINATFGKGIRVNPHVVAFALLAKCIDNYLRSLPSKPLGMLISDESEEIVDDVEKSIRFLKGHPGTLRLSRIVEKGFFINSAKSLPLQLCDLFALSVRKFEEREWAGVEPSSIDDTGIAKANALVFKDFQNDADVLAWLIEQESERKKEAARGKSPGSTDAGP